MVFLSLRISFQAEEMVQWLKTLVPTENMVLFQAST